MGLQTGDQALTHAISQQRQYLFLNRTEASAREQQSPHIIMLNDPGMRIHLCPRTGLGKCWLLRKQQLCSSAVVRFCQLAGVEVGVWDGGVGSDL